MLRGVASIVMAARGYDGAARALADLIAGSAAGALVDLFTNDINPSGVQKIDDFELPSYTGYVQGTVTAWGPVHREGNDAVADATDVVTFTGPALGSGPIAYGFILHKLITSTEHLIAAFRFDQPVSLTDDTYSVAVVPSLIMAAAAA